MSIFFSFKRFFNFYDTLGSSHTLFLGWVLPFESILNLSSICAQSLKDDSISLNDRIQPPWSNKKLPLVPRPPAMDNADPLSTTIEPSPPCGQGLVVDMFGKKTVGGELLVKEKRVEEEEEAEAEADALGLEPQAHEVSFRLIRHEILQHRCFEPYFCQIP